MYQNITSANKRLESYDNEMNKKTRIFDNEIEQMKKKQGLLYAFRTTVYCIGLLLRIELDQCLLFFIR